MSAKLDMQDLDKIKRVLKEIAHRYDIEGLQLNTYGAVGLELHDGQEIHLEYISLRRKLFMCTPLTALADDSRKRHIVLETAMKLNCLEAGAEDGVLMLDPQGRVVQLQCAIDVETLTTERVDRSLHKLLAQRVAVLKMLNANDSPANGGKGAFSRFSLSIKGNNYAR